MFLSYKSLFALTFLDMLSAEHHGKCPEEPYVSYLWLIVNVWN